MRRRSNRRLDGMIRMLVFVFVTALGTACGGDEGTPPEEGSEWGSMHWGSGSWEGSAPP